MNAFSVPRHERSQIEENICIFCKMPAKTNHYYFLCVAWWGLLAHMFPESFSFTLNGSISLITVTLESDTRCVSEPTAAFPELKRPHVHYHPSVTVWFAHLPLEVIWPLEIYLSWSEDAPWLSAVGCVRLVYTQEASSCMGEVIHTLQYTSSTFRTLLHRDTHKNLQ